MFKLHYGAYVALLSAQLFLTGQQLPTYVREHEEELQYGEQPYNYQERAPHAYYRRWKEDNFLEKQYEDSLWPARRDDELSDQLSR